MNDLEFPRLFAVHQMEVISTVLERPLLLSQTVYS